MSTGFLPPVDVIPPMRPGLSAPRMRRMGGGMGKKSTRPLSEYVDWELVEREREPKPDTTGDERRRRRRESDAAYYRRHRETVDRNHREWREKNKGLMRRYDRAYAAAHKRERAEASRRWRERFKAEHGMDYSTWRRRQLNGREDPTPRP